MESGFGGPWWSGDEGVLGGGCGFEGRGAARPLMASICCAAAPMWEGRGGGCAVVWAGAVVACTVLWGAVWVVLVVAFC